MLFHYTSTNTNTAYNVQFGHKHVHSFIYQFPPFFIKSKAKRGSDNMRVVKECQLNGIITSYITLLTSMSSAFHFRAAILSFEHEH